MKGIIFDVDGTLWDSTREVAVAWNKVLQDEMEGHEILTAEGLQKEFGSRWMRLQKVSFRNVGKRQDGTSR